MISWPICHGILKLLLKKYKILWSIYLKIMKVITVFINLFSSKIVRFFFQLILVKCYKFSNIGSKS